MPFSIVRSSSRERFTEVHINLSYIESIEPVELVGEATIAVKILRGLYYVHLYSALEKAVNETIEQTILLIKSENVKNRHYSMPFNVISLNSKMRSFKDCGRQSYFKKAAEVFLSVDSEDSFDIPNTVISQNLQNVRLKTIQEIIDCFGAKQITFEPRVRFTIDEVVEKRNAVAHGRETPVFVGERYRANILRAKTKEIQHVVNLVIDTFEDYIKNKIYLKPDYVHYYQAG